MKHSTSLKSMKKRYGEKEGKKKYNKMRKSQSMSSQTKEHYIE